MQIFEKMSQKALNHVLRLLPHRSRCEDSEIFRNFRKRCHFCRVNTWNTAAKEFRSQCGSAPKKCLILLFLTTFFIIFLVEAIPIHELCPHSSLGPTNQIFPKFFRFLLDATRSGHNSWIGISGQTKRSQGLKGNPHMTNIVCTFAVNLLVGSLTAKIDRRLEWRAERAHALSR